MKPPLERAARALCELAGNPPGATMDGKPLWMDYLPEVRAVVEALREVDDSILRRADSAISAASASSAPDRERVWPIGSANVKAGYHAILDAILRDNPKPGAAEQ